MPARTNNPNKCRSTAPATKPQLPESEAKWRGFQPLSYEVAKYQDKSVLGKAALEKDPRRKLEWLPISADAMQRQYAFFNATKVTIKGKCPESFWNLLKEIATAIGRQISLPEYEQLLALYTDEFGNENERKLLALRDSLPERHRLHLVNDEKPAATLKGPQKCGLVQDCWNSVEIKELGFLVSKNEKLIAVCKECRKVLVSQAAILGKPEVVFMSCEVATIALKKKIAKREKEEREAQRIREMHDSAKDLLEELDIDI